MSNRVRIARSEVARLERVVDARRRKLGSAEREKRDGYEIARRRAKVERANIKLAAARDRRLEVDRV